MNSNESAVSAELTYLERKVVEALFTSSDGNGHDFGFSQHARSVVDSPRQLGGVISSLQKKGVITVYEECNGYCQVVFRRIEDARDAGDHRRSWTLEDVIR